jgi:dTDP-4-amino-4,6-dideoxygalactose transaminase
MVDRVPLLDLGRQYAPIKSELDAAVLRVMEHGRFINGPEVGEFEKQVADFVGVKHAVGVASGTDALLLALKALDVGPGTEVIIPTFTFFATAGAVSNLGAKPVFVDVDPQTLNIDPAGIEKAITDKTRAIMPVHLFGQCADMGAIDTIARARQIPVVEDAAQALSARYGDHPAGSLGQMGCYSFFPTKNLGCLGDGGLIVTNDDGTAELLRKLKSHGAKPKYFHQIVGFNSRLDTIHAAALSVKFPHLNSWTEQRRKNAARYHELLKDVNVERPVDAGLGYHIYNQYTISLDRRDAFRDHMRSRNIGHEVYYPVPLHMQECFTHLGAKAGDFPVSEAAAKRVCSLPIFPELTHEEQDYVVQAVKDFVGT